MSEGRMWNPHLATVCQWDYREGQSLLNERRPPDIAAAYVQGLRDWRQMCNELELPVVVTEEMPENTLGLERYAMAMRNGRQGSDN